MYLFISLFVFVVVGRFCVFCFFLFLFLRVSVLDLSGKQYQKNPPGFLQDTNLLQLLLCAKYKITLYIAFSRNPLCAASKQSKDTWAYLYYLC